VARVTPLFAGVNYERLEGYKSLQWPVHADGRTRRCCLRRSFRSRMARLGSFRSRIFLLREEMNETYDLHLKRNGRLLEHFEQGSNDVQERRGLRR